MKKLFLISLISLSFASNFPMDSSSTTAVKMEARNGDEAWALKIVTDLENLLNGDSLLVDQSIAIQQSIGLLKFMNAEHISPEIQTLIKQKLADIITRTKQETSLTIAFKAPLVVALLELPLAIALEVTGGLVLYGASFITDLELERLFFSLTNKILHLTAIGNVAATVWVTAGVLAGRDRAQNIEKDVKDFNLAN